MYSLEELGASECLLDEELIIAAIVVLKGPTLCASNPPSGDTASCEAAVDLIVPLAATALNQVVTDEVMYICSAVTEQECGTAGGVGLVSDAEGMPTRPERKLRKSH